jgi:hypothetical protein
MKILRGVAAVVLSLVTSASVLAADDQEAKNGETGRPCVANFKKEGNSFVGNKIVSSWQEHKGVTFDSAFRKVAQATSQLGWAGMNANKDTGTITAGELGANISIAVSETADGSIRVDAKILLAGSSFPDKKSKNALCVSVEAPAK